MKTTTAAFLTGVLLAACGVDSVSPAELGIEIDLPRLRVAGTPGWHDEAELLVLQAGETFEGPSNEAIDATTKDAAFLLCVEPGLDVWPAIGNAFSGAIFHGRPRMYFAGRGAGSGVDAIAMVANRGLEDELRRVSYHLVPSDVGPKGAFELRITRTGDVVRYRWRRLGTSGPITWDLGDVTLSARDDLSEGSGPAIPALAKSLEERTTRHGSPRALVAFELGNGVLPVHFLRALECGRGSREIAFVPVMKLGNPVEVLRIDLPVPEPGVDGGINEDGSAEGWLVVSLGVGLLEGSPRFGQLEYRVGGCVYGAVSEIPLPDPPPSGLYLRVDSEQLWSLCDPLVRWAASKRIPVRFALSKEDPNFWRERSIEVLVGEGGTGRILRIPVGTTAGSVIRDAHRMQADGATTVEFVLEH